MKNLDVQALKLGPKPRAWTASVLGNLKRLATDQSIPSKVRQNLEDTRELIFDILNSRAENGEWRIEWFSKEDH